MLFFCCCSVTKSCPTLCEPMDCSIPGFPVLHYLLEFAQIHIHWSMILFNHLISDFPFSSSPQSFPTPGSFLMQSALCIRWPKYWSFSFSISPSNEHSGLISCMIDWLDLFAVQGTLESLLQHHSLKTSVLRCSAFFMVQLLNDYCKNHSFD